MHLIQWQQPARELPSSEVDGFFHRPLSSPTLFKFKTENLELPAHRGAFSLKLVLSGMEEYQIGHRIVTLRPGQLLFLNAGETYSSRISRETESISIFLPEEERLAAFDAVFAGDEDALDRKSHGEVHSEVSQVAYRPCDASKAALDLLLHAVHSPHNEDPMEATRLFTAEAIRSLFRLARPSALTDYVKIATRDELLQRLLRARALIDDTQGQEADLDRLANSACLSKYYFLRLFSETFGRSPGAYARQLRLTHAMAAIRSGENPQRAARKAGYDDLRAFRRACQRNKV